MPTGSEIIPQLFKLLSDEEEALAVLRKCEEDGLVHVTMNKMHVGHFICNCCGLCQVTCPEEAISLVAVREEDFIPS